jgi:hypothetical protein
LDPLDAGFKESLLDNAAKLYLGAKGHGIFGCLPHGFMKNLVDGLKKYPCLSNATRDTVRNHVMRWQKKDQEESDDEIPDEQEQAVVTPPPDNDHESCGGCPKGSTNAAKAEENNNYLSALEWAAEELHDMQQALDQRLPRGTIASILAEVQKKFNLMQPIKRSTIQARVKHGNFKGRMKSPMEETALL